MSSWGMSVSEWREDLQSVLRVYLDCEVHTRDSSSKPNGFSVGMTGLGEWYYLKIIILNGVINTLNPSSWGRANALTWGSTVGTLGSPWLRDTYCRFLVETLRFLYRNDRIGGMAILKPVILNGAVNPLKQSSWGGSKTTDVRIYSV